MEPKTVNLRDNMVLYSGNRLIIEDTLRFCFATSVFCLWRAYAWSLSPNNFNGSNANVFNVNTNGNLNNNNVNNSGAVAPATC